MTNNQLKIFNNSAMFDLVGDDKELIKKFQIEFLQQAKQSIAKLSDAYGQSDFTTLKEEAHFLKTSAKAIGAEQTGDYLQQLEDISELNDKNKCKELIILINNSIKQVYGVIKNEI
ncbi:Hpt domain-containing protein [Pseudocolwellia sp. AS88]|jgi:HPt (histidine-containing phosphotransfer) domain-containing protein|uniref:Hpt domain-containing protein n=1 Tax=Pseudocolwellia TaxID=2848177 RepID=UPI0026F031BE|nr:Hpt domain-containing protein [Pseudocolwellia sp. AS88]MDO7085861.1 Hpt domain-containing protein [Pseudocolwellia sp. AS88]